MRHHGDSFSIGLDGGWSLQELYEYSHAFSDAYALVLYLACLQDGRIEPEKRQDIDGEEALLGSLPWRGGYSSLSFYQRIKRRLPSEDRPQIRQIQYHSPGVLELALYVPTALAISVMIKTIINNFDRILDLVRKLYETLHDLKLMKIDASRKELELKREQIEFLKYAIQNLDSALEIPHAAQIDELAPNDLAGLKLRLSLFRKVKTLAEFQKRGKANLLENQDSLPNKSTEEEA